MSNTSNNFSKRQDQLKKRVQKAREVLTKSKHAMQTTLLNELARNGVYNINDFHKVYIKRNPSGRNPFNVHHR